MEFAPETSAVPERLSVVEEFPAFLIVASWFVLPVVEDAASVP